MRERGAGPRGGPRGCRTRRSSPGPTRRSRTAPRGGLGLFAESGRDPVPSPSRPQMPGCAGPQMLRTRFEHGETRKRTVGREIVPIPRARRRGAVIGSPCAGVQACPGVAGVAGRRRWSAGLRLIRQRTRMADSRRGPMRRDAACVASVATAHQTPPHLIEAHGTPRSGERGDSAPGWTRTSNPRLRRPVLYPVELRGPVRQGTLAYGVAPQGFGTPSSALYTRAVAIVART
jgi:hypothetical protein